MSTRDSTPAEPPTPDAALLSSLSVTEKLILAQAVYQVGSADFKPVVKLLFGHPLLERGGKTKGFFSIERAPKVFAAMLRDPDIELDPDVPYAANGPELLKVAKKYYYQRVLELRELMQLEQDQFRIHYSEIQEIKAGAWDAKMALPEPPPLSTRPAPAPKPTASGKKGKKGGRGSKTAEVVVVEDSESGGAEDSVVKESVVEDSVVEESAVEEAEEPVGGGEGAVEDVVLGEGSLDAGGGVEVGEGVGVGGDVEKTDA